MASSSQFSLLILFLNLFLLTGFTFARGISTTDLIPSVCKKTINQTFCLEILGSNPEAKTAHLFTLEKIAINLTITQVNATNDKIQSLLLKEKDPKLRNLYGNCSSNYEDAFAFLDQANLYLQSKQFWEVIYSARDACQDITFCEQSFKKAALHFPLSKYNHVLSLLFDIIVVISSMLLK
nr:pectinesterase inhibitor-like [Nicotiana tomentosiformis]